MTRTDTTEPATAALVLALKDRLVERAAQARASDRTADVFLASVALKELEGHCFDFDCGTELGAPREVIEGAVRLAELVLADTTMDDGCHVSPEARALAETMKAKR